MSRFNVFFQESDCVLTHTSRCAPATTRTASAAGAPCVGLSRLLCGAPATRGRLLRAPTTGGAEAAAAAARGRAKATGGPEAARASAARGPKAAPSGAKAASSAAAASAKAASASAKATRCAAAKTARSAAKSAAAKAGATARAPAARASETEEEEKKVEAPPRKASAPRSTPLACLVEVAGSAPTDCHRPRRTGARARSTEQNGPCERATRRTSSVLSPQMLAKPPLFCDGTKSTPMLRVPLAATRSVVRLRGPDALALLQNLCTHDVAALTVGAGHFAHFLSAKGRTLYDGFVWRDAADVALVEVDASLRERFLRHLSMFRLRLRVDVEPAPPLVAVHYHVPRTTGQLAGEYADLDASALLPRHAALLRDPRLPESWRAYESPSGGADNACEGAGHHLYRALRYLNGCGEGQAELGFDRSIPLECNLDMQQGVSFDKGCYLGQELIARVHHVGLVRKRLWPLKLTPLRDGSGPVVAAAARGQELALHGEASARRESGRIVAWHPRYEQLVLGLVRLSHVAAEDALYVTSASGERLCVAWTLDSPPWTSQVLVGQSDDVVERRQ